MFSQGKGERVRSSKLYFFRLEKSENRIFLAKYCTWRKPPRICAHMRVKACNYTKSRIGVPKPHTQLWIFMFIVSMQFHHNKRSCDEYCVTHFFSANTRYALNLRKYVRKPLFSGNSHSAKKCSFFFSYHFVETFEVIGDHLRKRSDREGIVFILFLLFLKLLFKILIVVKDFIVLVIVLVISVQIEIVKSGEKNKNEKNENGRKILSKTLLLCLPDRTFSQS